MIEVVGTRLRQECQPCMQRARFALLGQLGHAEAEPRQRDRVHDQRSQVASIVAQFDLLRKGVRHNFLWGEAKERDKRLRIRSESPTVSWSWPLQGSRIS